MDAEPLSRFASALSRDESAHHHAAWALHCMALEDRQWILGRLSAEQRRTVQRLLDELLALGLPARAEISATVLPAPEPRPSKPPAALERLQALPAPLACLLLEGEPDMLVADVLRLGPFRWQAALLERLGPRRRAIQLLLERSERTVTAPPIPAGGERGDASALVPPMDQSNPCGVRRDQALADRLAERATHHRVAPDPQRWVRLRQIGFALRSAFAFRWRTV